MIFRSFSQAIPPTCRIAVNAYRCPPFEIFSEVNGTSIRLCFWFHNNPPYTELDTHDPPSMTLLRLRVSEGGDNKECRLSSAGPSTRGMYASQSHRPSKAHPNRRFTPYINITIIHVMKTVIHRYCFYSHRSEFEDGHSPAVPYSPGDPNAHHRTEPYSSTRTLTALGHPNIQAQHTSRQGAPLCNARSKLFVRGQSLHTDACSPRPPYRLNSVMI